MTQDYGLGAFVYAGHYALLRHVLDTYRPQGIALEFGVATGESARLIAEYMPVIGFDSFQGLPEDWRTGFPAGIFAQRTIPDIPNVELVVGSFEDTLPGFTPPDEVGLVHIDCDLYSSTKTVLEHIELPTGCFVVFDEWYGYPECEQHEQRAWREASADLVWKVVGHSHQQWAVQIA